jgi:hypothetical protein
MAPQRNEKLSLLLQEVGWSPRALVRRINRILGSGAVAETAAYHWRDAGRTPRPPLPAVTAWVLSEELGRRIAVGEIWEGRADDTPLSMPADFDAAVPFTRPGALGVLEDWTMNGLMDRRIFLQVSGSALAVVVGHFTDKDAWIGAGSDHISAGDGAVVGQIDVMIPMLQRLDDASGGGAYLPYVGAQFRSIALLLRETALPDNIERRLFAALAELGQLAGWMAFDAGQHGLAQRYFFTALRCARAAGYQSIAAHVLADLAFQAATCAHGQDAVMLGEAARDASRRATPCVRASVLTRLAYGYAVAGRIDDHDTAFRAALDNLAAGNGAAEPEWMYYLTEEHLHAQAGYALVHAGTLADNPTRRTLMRRGEQLLRGGAHDLPLRDPSSRRALFEGSWLAVAVAYQGDLEQATSIAATALSRLDDVRSDRSTRVLGLLDNRLRKATRNEYAASFRPTLRDALVRQNASAR